METNKDELKIVTSKFVIDWKINDETKFLEINPRMTNVITSMMTTLTRKTQMKTKTNRCYAHNTR